MVFVQLNSTIRPSELVRGGVIGVGQGQACLSELHNFHTSTSGWVSVHRKVDLLPVSVPGILIA
jgi:hypothetical protein